MGQSINFLLLSRSIDIKSGTRTAMVFSQIYFQTRDRRISHRMVPNHYFSRLVDHNVKSAVEEVPFVFYFLCRNCFLCDPSFALQCFPRKSFHLTIPSHHHQSSIHSIIRDFLRLNIFYDV